MISTAMTMSSLPFNAECFCSSESDPSPAETPRVCRNLRPRAYPA
jgi:hypothetical protein